MNKFGFFGKKSPKPDLSKGANRDHLQDSGSITRQGMQVSNLTAMCPLAMIYQSLTGHYERTMLTKFENSCRSFSTMDIVLKFLDSQYDLGMAIELQQ